MTKDNPYEWDATAINNADIGGIGIEGSDLPSNFDNALRELMAQQAKRIAAVNGTIVSTGSSNAYVVSSGQSYGALDDGIEVAFMANHTNTGAATLAVDGLIAKAIRKPDGSALIDGDIENGQFCRLAYDAGNEYWLLSSLPSKVGYAGSVAKTAAFTVATSEIGQIFSCDASGGAFTVTLPAAATATGRFVAAVANTGSSNDVTIDPDGSELVNGETDLVLPPGTSTLLRCDGSEWVAVGAPESSLSSAYAEATGYASTAGAPNKFIPFDNTKPQITEGEVAVTTSITPTNANNKLRIRATVHYGSDASFGPQTYIIALFRAGTNDAFAVDSSTINAGRAGSLSIDVEVDANGTSAETWSVRYGPNVNTAIMYINGVSSGARFGSAQRCTITIDEVSS